MIEDRSSKDYWDWRVDSHMAEQGKMIWYGSRGNYEYFENFVKSAMETWKDMTALDVACGYGRFAPCFDKDKYYGFDFSSKMIDLAKEKYPGYKFGVEDIRDHLPEQKYDIIFEVMMGAPWGIGNSGFIEKYKPYANVAVACFHPGTTTIEFINLK